MKSSARLRKVLGIVSSLGNRLVGRNPGRTQTCKLSVQALDRLLDGIDLHSNPKGNFLGATISGIRNSNPSLLKLREEMPSLDVVAGKLDWERLRADIASFEGRFEAFRTFAVSLSATKSGLEGVTLSVAQEVEVLQSTNAGYFAVDGCLRMASLYEMTDEAQHACEALESYFNAASSSEEDKVGVDGILTSISRFCDYVDQLDGII